MVDLGNSLDYISKCWVAATVSLNSTMARNAAIETEKISTLADYMKKYDPTKLRNYNPELKDDKRLLRTYVVPITMPNGQTLDLIVNAKGQDIASVDLEDDSRCNISPEYREKIMGAAKEHLKNIENVVDLEKEIPKELGMDELADKISKDELIPKNKQAALKTVGISNDMESEELETENEKEIPAEARDKISKIFEENPELNMSDLKQVMQVADPKSVGDKLENDTIQPNGGEVTALRFRGKEANTKDRVVMIQDGKVIDERKFDNTMTELMNDKCAPKVDTLEDHDSQLQYIDENGQVYVMDIRKEPIDDMTIEQKEDFKREITAAMLERNQHAREGEQDDVIRENVIIRNIADSYGLKLPEVEDDKTTAEMKNKDGSIEVLSGLDINVTLCMRSLEECDRLIEETKAELRENPSIQKNAELQALIEKRAAIPAEYGVDVEIKEPTIDNLEQEPESELGSENDDDWEPGKPRPKWW